MLMSRSHKTLSLAFRLIITSNVHTLYKIQHSDTTLAKAHNCEINRY